MPKCEHFVYTAGKIGDNEGYQVIAKSAGIDDQTISELSEYLYPLGVKVSEFNESRSLLILSRGKISYSIVKNIGIGYDGRRGTLYNHTFVMDKTDFEKLDFDSRIFDKHFSKYDKLRRELKPIQINPEHISPDFDLLIKIGPNLLKEILLRLLRGKKIAITNTDELKLLQNLLAVLPPLRRLIPFSTVVVEPDRQYKFEFIQIPERIQSKLEKSFTIINPEQLRLTRRRSIYDDSVEELVQIILNKNEKLLQQIFKAYEKIPSQLSRVRRIKIEEIFNESEFEYLAKKNSFGRIKNKVKTLCHSRKFNQASPKIKASITRKIRKIIKKGLTNKKLTKKKHQKNIEQVAPIVKILLDPMHYLNENIEQKIGNTQRNEIYHEIKKLEEILEEFTTSETMEKPYTFNFYEYTKAQAELFVKSVQAGIAYGLWWLGFPIRNE